MSNSTRPARRSGVVRWLDNHRRGAAIGVAVAAVGLVGIAILLAVQFAEQIPVTGGATMSPAATLSEATPSDEPTDSPTPIPTPTAEPTVSPTATPRTSPTAGPIASWELAASFDVDPGTAYVTDVTAWNHGFVAIGSAWEGAHIAGSQLPRVWTSADGGTWEERTADLGIDDVSLVGIEARGDGTLLLVGNAPGTGAQGGGEPPRPVAWISEDAIGWEPHELPATEDEIVYSLDRGARGYVLSAGTKIWFSSDGMEWSLAHDGGIRVVAGDEGFAAMNLTSAGSMSIIASGDGRDWYTSEPFGPLLDVAPIGGAWVAVASTEDRAGFLVLRSEDGLEWSEVLDVNDLTGPDGPKTGRGLERDSISGASLAGSGGHVFLTLTGNHCCAQIGWNFGVWGSTDGVTWQPAIEGDAFVSAVASDGDTTVLGGHLRRGEDPAFWIGER